MEPITRAQAMEQGLSEYFTGKPCSRGHVAARNTSRWQCVECVREWDRERYQRDRDKRKTAVMERYHNDPEPKRKAVRARALAFPEKKKASDRSWAVRNQWRRNAHERLRYARANSVILSKEEAAQHRAIYRLREVISRETGVEHHVDHRIPLARGGTDHPSNLWVIPASVNLRKGAKILTELEWAELCA